MSSREKAYTIQNETLLQPLDHDKPGGETFRQHIKLLIPKAAAFEPTVFFILGNESAISDGTLESCYRAYGSRNDIVFILAEHRGYGQSLSEDPNQSVPRYVTIQQALADYHAVAVKYRQQYTGRWIAAGYSYGGGLAIHYGYLYPGDADVILSSSGVVDWPFLLDSYEDQVKENLGDSLYTRLTGHITRLSPSQPFNSNWRGRELIYAFVTAISQYELNHTRLTGLIRCLSLLPTRWFVGALRLLDRTLAGGAAGNYVSSNSKPTLAREEALSGKYSWRVWRYQQFWETGTCWFSKEPEGLYRNTVEDWAAECELLFGEKPPLLKKDLWKVRDMVPALLVPLVYVCGGKDPWKAVCLPKGFVLTQESYLYFDSAFHCPDRNEVYGKKVMEELLKYGKTSVHHKAHP